jgi:hypothetical protein
MDENSLYQVVHFILNEADEEELKVVVEALKRRLGDEAKGPMGLSPEKLGRAMAGKINEQVQESLDSVHDTVQRFIAEMIRREAPDIPEEDLEALIDEWAPKPGRKPRQRPAPNLPPDVLLTMVRQFVDYGRGAMHGGEQKKLWDEIPDWQEKYWAAFPESVRRLIGELLKKGIDEKSFWERIRAIAEENE